MKDEILIKTPRLVLRKLRTEDAPEFYGYRSQAEVQEFQSFQPKTLAETESFLASLAPELNVPETWYQLAVCLKETGSLIGDLGLHFTQDEAQTEIGVTLAPAQQRCGYATEALEAVLGYLFDELGKHRVYASVDPLNTASVGLLEKLGLRKEAHFRKSYRLPSGWGDDVIYAMLEEEWFDRRPDYQAD